MMEGEDLHFVFALALARNLSIEQVLALPALEYTCWQIYFKLYPWGWRSDNVQFAALKQTIVGAMGGKRVSLNDMLIKFRKSDAEHRADEIEFFANLERIAKASQQAK